MGPYKTIVGIVHYSVPSVNHNQKSLWLLVKSYLHGVRKY